MSGQLLMLIIAVFSLAFGHTGWDSHPGSCQQVVVDREPWRAAARGVVKSPARRAAELTVRQLTQPFPCSAQPLVVTSAAPC